MHRLGRAALVRILLVSVVLGLYVYAWSPYGRTAYIQYVAIPTLTETASGDWAVEVRADEHHLTLASDSSSRSIGVTAPAGLRFLLPALGLVVLAPRKLYWIGLWGGHVALGLWGLGTLMLGLWAVPLGFVLYDASTAYLLDAFSLGVAVFAVHAELDLTRSLSQPTDG